MDDTKGLLGWSFSLVSLVFSIMLPTPGIISSIVGMITSHIQYKRHHDSWSKTGRLLGIVAFIISVVLIILSYVVSHYFPNYLGGVAPVATTP